MHLYYVDNNLYTCLWTKTIKRKINKNTHEWSNITEKGMIVKITWLIRFGSVLRGDLRTANRERDVNALAGVKSPPSRT